MFLFLEIWFDFSCFLSVDSDVTKTDVQKIATHILSSNNDIGPKTHEKVLTSIESANTCTSKTQNLEILELGITDKSEKGKTKL